MWVRIIYLTMASTLHISDLKYAPTHSTCSNFGNEQNRRRLFTRDLLLFKPNAARDEGISANSQTLH